MSPAEAAALLAIAAAFDNRKPDADAATAWALALDGWRFEDCREAVVAHYRATNEWIMPSDVIGAVKNIRRERLLNYGPIEPPPSLDPDDDRAYFQWLRDAQTAIADGQPLPDAADYPQLHRRTMPDMSELLPRIAPVPPAKRAAYRDKLEAARAELAARRPIPTPQDAAIPAEKRDPGIERLREQLAHKETA